MQEDSLVNLITTKKRVWDQLRQRDCKIFARLLPDRVVRRAAQQAGLGWGRGPLHVGTLVWLGLCSTLHTAKSFAAILLLVIKLLHDLPEAATGPRRYGKRARAASAVSEEAFVQARRKLPTRFWNVLLNLLVETFEQQQTRHAAWKEFRLLALDGTTIRLPHWKRLAAYFGSAGNGRGQQRTQARLVMLQLPQTRLPWRYALTPLSQGERPVAQSLLHDLRPRDLVLMDRGFWSYGAFWQIQEQGAFFAIRKVKQARWKVLRRLERGDYLVRHQPCDHKKKWRGLPKAMDLRYIPYQLAGFRPSGVVTNVLDPARVSREEWVRLAAVDDAGRALEPGLYHRRWEIETTFRELKVTQGLEGHLRSRTPEGIAYEVGGQILFYLLLRWLIVEVACAAGLDDPLRLSFKGALNELEDMRSSLLCASVEYACCVLLPRLLERISTHRVPLRPGRHFPRPRDSKPKNKGNNRHQKPSKIGK
jgi:Transposase DDE domain